MKALIPVNEQRGVFRPGDGVFGNLQREIDRLFDNFTRTVATPTGPTAMVPRMDIVETDKEIEITAELPGLEQKDVQITIEDGVLTIRGEKKAGVEEESKDRSYRLVERMYGAFYRSVQLPSGVDADRIEAKMSSGVLKITIPKPAKPEPKKVEVKTAA
jgi:HSP20 family protein